MNQEAVYQLVAGFTPGDAISNIALRLRIAFRRRGMHAEIAGQAGHIHPSLHRESLTLKQLEREARPHDLALLHLSIGSDVNDAFAALPCRKAIMYHNITPPHFFEDFGYQAMAHLLRRGREQAQQLVGTADCVMAVSRFNATELNTMGYADPIHVLPFLLDRLSMEVPPDPATLDLLDDGKTNILFIGRGVPNKRIEDIIRATSFYKHGIHAGLRFIHAGSYQGYELYQALLATLARYVGVGDETTFTGPVTQACINALYRRAHVFVCLSEHEGFCIPLLEAMAHDIPVLAYAAAAIPETMDGAGVLLKQKQLAQTAEMIHALAHDGPLRQAVIADQRKRLQRHMADDLEDAVARILLRI